MENLKSILIPTDFSPTAWQAILAGIKMAKNIGAPINLIHITPTSIDEPYQDELTTRLQNIADNLSSIYAVSVASIVIKGEPREVIEQYIIESHTEMIVMGLNSTGGNEIGNLTGYVMHHLNCPVTVVPPIKNKLIVA